MTETLEGFLVDVACIRKYPRREMADRARSHTRSCALHGHCIESGYGLIDDMGNVMLLDPEATPLVLDAVRQNRMESGIRLRVCREMQDGEMKTIEVKVQESAEQHRKTG